MKNRVSKKLMQKLKNNNNKLYKIIDLFYTIKKLFPKKNNSNCFKTQIK